ncbi:ribonuclease pancreatic-like [Talpa occidentalis]|uniref:ribonuclease pancreatic-like n=1 Tax=Talpa occidentalis TaxID=50954 RepID=UPI001890B376|nr:ribonuclease pancreatic-like [Talpa occidentalis]
MALKCLVLFSLLVVLVLVGAQPPAAQNFHQRHMDTNPRDLGHNYCNQMMRNRNLLNRNFNTFVHETFAVVQAVCREPRIRCRNGENNCHRSRQNMMITDCNLTGLHPNPTYNTNRHQASIIIACVGNPPVPVHFDGSG